MAVNGVKGSRQISDPCPAYVSMEALWEKCRAACSGEMAVKEFDRNLDTLQFSNMLIPFSSSMTSAQYNFYKAEAEWPGVTGQYVKVLLGGLLRKKPQLSFDEAAKVPDEAVGWLMNSIAKDGASLTSFLDEAVFEELQTSRAWAFVDFPKTVDSEMNQIVSDEDMAEMSPFVTMRRAEEVINWGQDENGALRFVVVRSYREEYQDGEFHPELREVLHIHAIENGEYVIRVFEEEGTAASVKVTQGTTATDTSRKGFIERHDLAGKMLVNGSSINFLPIWPLNGSIQLKQPLLIGFVDKEVSLYNKTSRRNHLLYGAATYTPVIFSDMLDTDFQTIVGAGLGSWLHLGENDRAEVLKAPSDSLADMDRSIAAGYEELAKLGIRILTPETAQSGVALELRNAAQNAQLGSMNARVSETMRAIIAFMVSWKFGIECLPEHVNFSMSEDFNPVPLGADWLRLVTEWYEGGLIPRSIWLQILKFNDIVPPDYDDKAGVKEIDTDDVIITRREQQAFDNELTFNANGGGMNAQA